MRPLVRQNAIARLDPHVPLNPYRRLNFDDEVVPASQFAMEPSAPEMPVYGESQEPEPEPFQQWQDIPSPEDERSGETTSDEEGDESPVLAYGGPGGPVRIRRARARGEAAPARAPVQEAGSGRQESPIIVPDSQDPVRSPPIPQLVNAPAPVPQAMPEVFDRCVERVRIWNCNDRVQYYNWGGFDVHPNGYTEDMPMIMHKRTMPFVEWHTMYHDRSKGLAGRYNANSPMIDPDQLFLTPDERENALLVVIIAEPYTEGFLRVVIPRDREGVSVVGYDRELQSPRVALGNNKAYFCRTLGFFDPDSFLLPRFTKQTNTNIVELHTGENGFVSFVGSEPVQVRNNHVFHVYGNLRTAGKARAEFTMTCLVP